MANHSTFLVAVLVLQVGLSELLGDANLVHHAATTPEKVTSPLDKMSEHLKNIYNDVTPLFEKHFPPTKQVSDKMAEQSHKFLDYVGSLRDTVNKQIGKNNERLNGVYKDISDGLSKQVLHLKESLGPDATSIIDKVQNRLEQCFKNVYHAVNKVVAAVSSEYIMNFPHRAKDATLGFAKGIANKFIETSRSLKTNLENVEE